MAARKMEDRIMPKKIIVVGGVAGGASAAARLRRLDESADITVYDRGRDVSYSNCSLPYLLSGTVASAEDLLMMTPQAFRSRFRLDVRPRHDVLKIDRQARRVQVKALDSGDVFWDAYDEVILSPGASPILPAIEGLDDANVFTIRNVQDISRLDTFVKAADAQTIMVIGGGFIGLEIAENLALAKVKVVLVEAAPQVMTPLDYDMAQIVHKVLVDHGIELIVSDGVKRFLPNGVVELSSGRRHVVEGVVMAVGVRPETSLARECGLAIGDKGGIAVNEHYQTNDPHIYAVGDAVEVVNRITGQPMRLALAGSAQRAARAAAGHICGVKDGTKPFLGSSVIKLFDWSVACTGLNEAAAKAAGFDCDSVYIIPPDRVGLMPGCAPLHLKLVYEKGTEKLLGAQAVSRGEAAKRIDVVAALLSMGGTLDDLQNAELCYAPAFGTAKDPVNLAALVAQNVHRGALRQVHVSHVRKLVEQRALIVDVREADEYAAGHIKGSVNIPLGQIRQRVDEIPRDVPVYLHCRTGQRSYYAIMCLQGMGYTNLTNISGSFLGLSYFEWFDDLRTGRDTIVTAYNFH